MEGHPRKPLSSPSVLDDFYLCRYKAEPSLPHELEPSGRTGPLLTANNLPILQRLVWPNSIRLRKAQIFLLNIYVEYIHVVGAEISELRKRNQNLDLEQLEEHLPDLGLFEYAAKY